jgi:hypothetical protein
MINKNTYLASHNYRGALNIGDMRVFDNIQDAFDWVDSVCKINYPSHGIHTLSFGRVYEFRPGLPPKLIKKRPDVAV